MKRALMAIALAIALAVVHGSALAEHGVDEPTFAMPIVVGGESACGAQSIAAIRVRGNSVLSILRGVQGSAGKAFLAVGPDSGKSDRASCVIDVRLERPLAEPRTLGVDFHGAERKDPGTTASLIIELGVQRHVFDYAEGRVLDDSPGKTLKRFQVVDLPAGTTHIRIAVSGKAARVADTAAALIGFEALDLCFVEPEEPQFCGGEYPNPRATP